EMMPVTHRSTGAGAVQKTSPRSASTTVLSVGTGRAEDRTRAAAVARRCGPETNRKATNSDMDEVALYRICRSGRSGVCAPVWLAEFPLVFRRRLVCHGPGLVARTSTPQQHADRQPHGPGSRLGDRFRCTPVRWKTTNRPRRLHVRSEDPPQYSGDIVVPPLASTIAHVDSEPIGIRPAGLTSADAGDVGVAGDDVSRDRAGRRHQLGVRLERIAAASHQSDDLPAPRHGRLPDRLSLAGARGVHADISCAIRYQSPLLVSHHHRRQNPAALMIAAVSTPSVFAAINSTPARSAP